MVSYFPIVTGSLTVLGNISVSGSITTSGSITISGSITSASFASTASYWSGSIVNAESASFASTASFVALAQSASNAVAAATASFANAFTVAGNLTAQTLVVQTITSSVIYSSGSNVFGNNIANTQTFTGSMNLTGSLTVVTTGTELQVTSTGVNLGNALTDSHNVTGSLRITGSALQISSSNYALSLVGGGSTRYAGTISNTSGNLDFGIEGSAGNQLFTGAGSYESGIGTSVAKNFHLVSNSTVRMTITSAGNVGIGTTNTSTEGNLFLGGLNATEGGQLILQKGTSQVSASHLDNYSNLFRIMSGTDTTSSNVRMSVDMTSGATIVYGTISMGNTITVGNQGGVDTTVITGGSGYGSKIQFNSPSGVAGQLTGNTDCYVNLFTGNFGIGTSSPGYKLTVNGQPGANGYTTFTNYSDSRLKENITNLNSTNILSKILSLRPVTFNYNELSGYDEATRSRRISGFIAQELMEVFPDMVGTITKEDTEYYDTNLSNLNLYLVKAIQELNTKFEEYKATHP